MKYADTCFCNFFFVCILQIRVFEMARNRSLSQAELQKILESEEFFEDLLILENNAELEDNVEELSDENPERIVAKINYPPQEIVDQTISTIETNDICHSVSLVDTHEFGLNNDSINSSQSEIVENEEPNFLNSHGKSSHASEKTNEDCESIPMMQDRDDGMPEGQNSESLESDVEPLDYSEEKDLRKRNRKLREKGLQYKTLRKNKDSEKYVYENEKGARKLRPTCQSVLCKKAKNRFCDSFSSLERKNIFSNFWKMSWDMKKVFVSSLVKTVPTRRPQEADSRRLQTLEYFLKRNGDNIRVCKKMFLSTLDLNEWMVKNWVVAADNSKLKDSKDISMPTKKRMPAELKIRINTLETFLNDLPKLESHYCRSSSNRLYLEPLYQTKTDVYQVYKDFCDTNGVKELSLAHFKKEMKIKNIFIHKPKKDQCDICIGYKTKNVSEEDYIKHIKRKEEARNEKENDKTEATENSELAIFTMDVQAVKLAPVLRASAIYYKTKLCVHNFTTFNLKNKEVNCYLWHEAEGGLEANIFASIITKHLFQFLEKEPSTKKIVIYSDGCGYQNRNNTLSNALYHFVNETNVTVIQKFLEKGHTQMEVDSAHSLIERRLKNKDIKLPSDYIEVCKKARPKQPFHVDFLEHTFFKNFSNLCYYQSIRPGNKKTDLHIIDIRCLKYEKNKGISYKINYSDNWTNLPHRLKVNLNPQIGRLYQSRLKIKQQKYEHLQALKKVLPSDCHNFYDSLPH